MTMPTAKIEGIWIAYTHTWLSVGDIAARFGVSRKHVHWAVDEWNRRRA